MEARVATLIAIPTATPVAAPTGAGPSAASARRLASAGLLPWVGRAYPGPVEPIALTPAPPVADSAPLPAPAAGDPILDLPARQALLAGVEGFGAAATGGLAGPLVLVDSLADAGPGSLREALERPGPAWVAFAVDGQIRLRSPIAVQSDKTVDGRGRRIELRGYGLDIVRAKNVIISHLILREGEGDAVSVRHEAQHVWLDHLTLVTFDDGLVDVTHGATDVTISWSRFEDHVKGMLLGANDWDDQAAVIRVSIHHNYFRQVQRRLPKLRYGRAHLYDNLVEGWYGPAVEVGFGGQVRLEGNVYLPDPDKSKAIVELDPDGPGVAGGGGNWTGGLPLDLYAVFQPDYSYTLDTPSEALIERLRAETGWQPAPWPFSAAPGAESD